MHRRFAAYAFTAAVLVSSNVASAQSKAPASFSQPMQFNLRPPNKMYQLVTGDAAWTIFASGEIDDGAPERLDALVRKNHIPPTSTLYFDSPGGSLVAGMKLGKVIRSAGFNTDVARYSATSEAHSVSGRCYSACTLAYLGGTWRYLTTGSAYGVHRFYFSKPTGADSDVAQMLSAVVVQYIRDMGANPDLFAEMTLSSKEEITIIPEQELERLNVVNNGHSPVTWTVVSADGVVYLKGQRNTAFGVNKFLLACTTDGTNLTIVMDPLGSDNPLPPTSAITLVLDEKQYPIEANMNHPPELYNGSVFIGFLLTPDIVRALEVAHKVGVEFQFARDAPSFVGFLDMDFDDGASKMSGVLRGCLP